MGLFKKKVVKEISGGVWGHLVNAHKLDVDTISRDLRCVEREGLLDGKVKVLFIRVFKPNEVAPKGITITGWETFDQHPELIIFEGYWQVYTNEARLEKKRAL
jgi:hypothetical protein